MFALRGVAVSVSVFVLLYCGLSAAVCLGWRRLHRSIGRHRMRRIADWLFALRMLPLAASVVITLACTIPSFLMFEPRAIVEPVGDIPLFLGLAGVVLAIIGRGQGFGGVASRLSHYLQVDERSRTSQLRDANPGVADSTGRSCHDGGWHLETEDSVVSFGRIPSQPPRIASRFQSRTRACASTRQLEEAIASLCGFSGNGQFGNGVDGSNGNGCG